MHLEQTRTKRQDCDPRPLRDDAPLADFQRHAAFGQFHPHTFATRKAECAGAIVNRGGGGDHMHQLGLVRGGHHHKTGQVGQIGDVKSPRMGRAIGPHQTGAVNGKAHGQTLHRHIMHNLIIAPLQECRIHRAKRLHSASGKGG